jgi:alpha-N-arabinofuranosidase
LTAPAINAINTFDHPDRVKPEPFDSATFKHGLVTVVLPPKSVVVLDLH